MKHKRLFIGVFLATILALLILYSGLEYNKYDPNMEYIIENFEKFNNTIISFDGTIEKINTANQQIIVSIEQTTYKINVTTNTITDKMQKGNRVEILGTLDEKYHVTAEKILLIERWKSDLIIIRSLPAIPFALYLFFKTWNFNKKTFRFERRKKNA